MAESIRDIDKYIRSMSTTLYDKCWWIDKLSDEIDTVVDFGCAQGDLAIMMNRISPGRFRYIGVDNSPEMLAIAKHNFSFHLCDYRAEFYSNLQTANEHIDRSKSVLILNSVLHEIFSYVPKSEWQYTLDALFQAGFKYIAIRDMHMPRMSHQQLVYSQDDIDAIVQGRHAKQWADFNNICSLEREGIWCSPELRMHEFFLKYRYLANWERESREQYLWDWTSILSELGYIRSEREWWAYTPIFSNWFFIPFTAQVVKRDFGIIWNYDTHKKWLLKLEDE